MRFLRQRFVDGRLRYAARPAYALVVGLELAAQRVLDTARPARGGRDAALLAQLTAVVKTFERPRRGASTVGTSATVSPSWWARHSSSVGQP